MTKPLPADTLPGYFIRQPNGELAPTEKLERLYAHIRDQLFAGKNDIRKAPFTHTPFLLYVAGGNGVGKSTWLEIAKNRGIIPGKDDANAVYMLNQFFKDQIPEMVALYDKNSGIKPSLEVLKKRDDAYWFGGGEALAMYLMVLLTRDAYQRGLTVVFDSQMAYKDEHLQIIENAKQYGYPAIQVGVFIDPENYPRRIAKRVQNEGRPAEYRTHLSRQGRFAKLFCEWEQSDHVRQSSDDTHRFHVGSARGSSKPCYADLFDVSILTSNNIDHESMKEGDVAYKTVAQSVKAPDGSVTLTVKDPEEYRLFRKLSQIDINDIRDDWNPDRLAEYIRGLKEKPEPALGAIQVSETNRHAPSNLRSKPALHNPASQALVSFVSRVAQSREIPRDAPAV